MTSVSQSRRATWEEEEDRKKGRKVNVNVEREGVVGRSASGLLRRCEDGVGGWVLRGTGL